MRSIEQRISFSLILTLLVTFATLGLLVNYGAQQLSREFVLTRLQHDNDNLIKALSLSKAQQWLIDTRYMPVIYQRVKSGHYFQFVSGEQQLRSRSLWDQTPVVAPLLPGESATRLEERGDERWLVWQQGIELQGVTGILWIAEDIAPLERQWRRFSVVLLVSMLVAMITLVILQRYLIRKSFSQLSDLQQAIKLLKQGEIKALSVIVPSEIQPLTNEINYLLERLEQRTSRSRTAVGNLAHELKRRLQHLYLFSSSLPDSVRDEYCQTLEQISQLIERELKRARIAGDSHPGRRFHPEEDLPFLIQMMKKIYPDIQIETTIGISGELPFDRDDMLELAGNLMDNACKFGLSKVRLELSSAEQTLALAVSNDGVGIPDYLKEQLLSRGVRTDESKAGYGLGLSICNMILTSYQGELDITSEDQDGGYVVKVIARLPLV